MPHYDCAPFSRTKGWNDPDHRAYAWCHPMRCLGALCDEAAISGGSAYVR